MDWIRSAFSGENSAVMLVLIFVGLLFALILLAWVFRKIAGESSVRTGRNRQPRLSVIDAAIVDDKRRLVLVRRDNVEHLVMIGGPTDVVIEPHISRGHPAAHVERAPERAPARPAEPAVRHEPQPEAAPEPAGEPPARAAQKIVAPQPREMAEPAVAAAAANSNGAPAANGHTIADEIQIDLEELQAAIDRSQLAEAAPPAAKPAPEPQVAAPPEPPAAPAVRAPSLEPDLASLKAAPKAARPKSMEDEMQRLLDELSGPIRN